MANSKVRVLGLALALVVILAGAGVLYTFLGKENTASPSGANTAESAAYGTAPDIQVYDTKGNTVTLSGILKEGKPVVLNFWASWCGPCKSEMPYFEKVYAEMGDEVSFVMVNLTDGSRETQQTAQEYVAQQGFSLPFYFDLDRTAAEVYSVQGIPTSYFINPQGKIVRVMMQSLSEEELRGYIDEIV